MSQILTDEQAALLWSDPSAVIAGDEIDNTITEEKSTDKDQATIVNDEDIDGVFSQTIEDDEDEIELNVKDTKVETKTEGQPSKQKGRKSDFITYVNGLLEKDGFEFEGGEIKTQEEAQEILSQYITNKTTEAVEEGWKQKLKEYPAQVQAVFAYADQGAQSSEEFMALFTAMKDVEDVYEYDLSTKEGKLKAVEDHLKAKGLKPSYIAKQIAFLKDAGDELIDETSKESVEELLEFNKQKVNQRIAEKAKQKEAAEKASRSYINTVTETLKKKAVGELELGKDEKYEIFEAVTRPTYQSLGGSNVTKFIKTLEDIQFGEQKNYDHFLNIVHFTVNPKGFMDKIKAKLKTEVAEDTMKAIRISKKTSANTEVETSDKKVIKLSSDFKNPFK